MTAGGGGWCGLRIVGVGEGIGMSVDVVVGGVGGAPVGESRAGGTGGMAGAVRGRGWLPFAAPD